MRLTWRRADGAVCPRVEKGTDYNYIAKDFTQKVYDKLAAYEDAEEQGLLVRLPCKVGDTVWTLNHHFRPVDGKVRSIHQNDVGDWAGRWVLTSFFPEYYGQEECGLDPDFLPTTKYFVIDDFGKTVFLSREEAEAALKGEGKDV